MITSAYAGTPKRGLSDYLAGRVNDYKEYIVNSEEHKNLYILPVGTIPPNPAELLEDELFGKCINELRTSYDYVYL